MCPGNRAFNLRPEAFDAVRVRTANNPFFEAVINAEMRIAQLVEASIPAVVVGIDPSSLFHVLLDDGLQGLLRAVGNDAGHNIALALQHPEHNRLVRHSALPAPASAPTADEGFVNLDFAGQPIVAVDLRQVVADQVPDGNVSGWGGFVR